MVCYIINLLVWILHCLTYSAIFSFGFELKDKKMARWKAILGLFLVQLPFVILKFVYNSNDFMRNMDLFCTVLANIGYLVLFFQGYLWQKLLFFVLAIVLSTLGEAVVQLFMQDALLQINTMDYTQPVMVIHILIIYVSTSLIMLFYVLVWRKVVTKNDFDMKIFFVFSVFPISQIILLFNIVLKVHKAVPLESVWTILGIFISVVADIALLVILLRQQSMYAMKIKLNAVETAWEVEKNHYRDIEARREELAKIRHDIEEQFLVMQALLQQENYEKVMDMLYTLREYVASTKEYVYCADPVVNAIMAEYERECHKRGIRFTYNLDIMQTLKINPVVICSIFSNLLRNAVAAAGEM